MSTTLAPTRSIYAVGDRVQVVWSADKTDVDQLGVIEALSSSSPELATIQLESGDRRELRTEQLRLVPSGDELIVYDSSSGENYLTDTQMSPQQRQIVEAQIVDAAQLGLAIAIWDADIAISIELVRNERPYRFSWVTPAGLVLTEEQRRYLKSVGLTLRSTRIYPNTCNGQPGEVQVQLPSGQFVLLARTGDVLELEAEQATILRQIDKPEDPCWLPAYLQSLISLRDQIEALDLLSWPQRWRDAAVTIQEYGVVKKLQQGGKATFWYHRLEAVRPVFTRTARSQKQAQRQKKQAQRSLQAKNRHIPKAEYPDLRLRKLRSDRLVELEVEIFQVRKQVEALSLDQRFITDGYVITNSRDRLTHQGAKTYSLSLWFVQAGVRYLVERISLPRIGSKAKEAAALQKFNQLQSQLGLNPTLEIIDAKQRKIAIHSIKPNGTFELRDSRTTTKHFAKAVATYRIGLWQWQDGQAKLIKSIRVAKASGEAGYSRAIAKLQALQQRLSCNP